MRVVIGSALIARASSRLWSDLPPMNVTIPAVLLIGAGILLIVGLWTPIVGSSIALIEIWKMLTIAGDKWVWLLLGNYKKIEAPNGGNLLRIIVADVKARLFFYRVVIGIAVGKGTGKLIDRFANFLSEILAGTSDKSCFFPCNSLPNAIDFDISHALRSDNFKQLHSDKPNAAPVARISHY